MQNELNPLLLSQNSIRFATRVAIFFIIRDELVEAITWKHPVKSVCLGLTITLLYLHPVSFSAILILIFVTMMPISLTHDVTTNLRDLQNFMASYSSSYDQLVHFRQNYYHYISPSTISSVLLTFLVMVSLLAFLRISIDRYLPIGLWIVLIALHPQFRNFFYEWYSTKRDRLPSLQLRNEVAQVWRHVEEKEGQTMTFYSPSPNSTRLPLVPSLELIDPPANYSWAPDSSWTFHSPNEFRRFVYWNPQPVKLKRTSSVHT
ncbi:peroxin Pex28/29 [Schizosaccharomyces cryophilus OY26]|uniref:Peroxin Pex28/29 n=1 Tax=Schizosaccharomyces cryophilus (strain OY26 / ATCC MYA-4695 / CBS 11777 / NBRC 106824 / NRRL Y48691) TaxID=653667 RepID=S9VZN9_SCHCR|nr:peroxin Pex28/29 [Schizosaccharomyces cryophilus OY26]EPY51295.1 peroxin Pex28/29 [Schizosaccharomyces cryophilus OY26]